MKARIGINILLVTLSFSWSAGVWAQSVQQEQEAMRAAHEAKRMEYEALIEEAELKRQLAVETAKEAQQALREIEALAEREAAELNEEQRAVKRAQTVEKALEAEELSLMREELSRSHRDLREVSRQVAQAHRALVASDSKHQVIRHINLGDRAVIGVVLGQPTDQGLEIIGVSPDGPAEQAGLLAGDIMVSIDGNDLVGEDSGREVIYRVMDEVEDGENLDVVVIRNQERLDLTVAAERREPTAWQSMIRITDTDHDLDEYGSVEVDFIEFPEIDHEAIAAEVAELQEKLEGMEFPQITLDEFGNMLDSDWEFDFGDMSEIGMNAIQQAEMWFGLPRAQGLELATVNPELGRYFDTTRGILVISAKEGNGFDLRSGDVVLEIDASQVDTPSDLMRELRELDSGETVDVLIKRERRDVTLKVVVPENRLTFDSRHYEADS